MIGQLEPEICTKMLKMLSEKLGPKFPATTPGCSMVKIARLDDVFFRSFLTASKPSRRSITVAKRKEKEKKERRKKNGFLRMPESKRRKTRCQWQERQAVVLQIHFRPD